MTFSELFPFEAIKESFSDPQRLHAIMVHVPIGATIIGLLLTLGVIITGSKASGLRWSTVFIYLLGTLAALWAVQTGDEAEHHLLVEPAGSALEALEKHEELARYFWVGLAATALLIMLSGIRVTWFKTIVLLLALVTALGSTVWVGAIGHHGGDMVFRHSIGVPSAGPIGTSDDSDDPTKDSDPDKDGSPTKDSAPTKDAESKDAKDSSSDVKDAPTKDANPGERKLPDVTKKDATIFD